jgi:hypothetical protein
MRVHVSVVLALIVGGTCTAAKGENAASTAARGPLRIHPSNPRYFTDGSGNVIILTGSHTWGNFQDCTYANLPAQAPFDFHAYLAFLKKHNHNFIRLWVWENAANPRAKQGAHFFDPMPYERPGPGPALDGKPKFDLTRFNPAYFQRLRAHVSAARDSGVYVSIMLFQGFSIEGKGNRGGDPWLGHPFNVQNNINGIDGKSTVHTLSKPAETRYQQAYVRHVVDTLNDLDNVLYEISNEDTGGTADTNWQYHMIRFIRRYEAAKAKQHPVGMTCQWSAGSDAVLRESPADWISPCARLPLGDDRKVILNDTDHSYFWTDLRKDGPAAQRAWVWENFTRGTQCLFMDPYLDPWPGTNRNRPTGGRPDPYWDTIRDAMGQTRSYAMRMDLGKMTPHSELASTGFCLANPTNEYLVYAPTAGELTVDVSRVPGMVQVKWFNPVDGATRNGAAVSGGTKRSFTTPFRFDAVLHLRKSQ